MLKVHWDNLVLKIFTLWIKYKARKVYPEALNVNLETLLGKQKKIKIAIIDDDKFPWLDALESRGTTVKYFTDYCKPVSQINQKSKIIDLSSFDLIICDVGGVGASIFPDLEGVAVIDDLRNKNPFHVIAAYTGNPGAITTKLKKNDCVDMTFSKDWSLEDFLLNYDKLAEIFKNPVSRWNFVRVRLSYLGVGEREIETFRKSFVEDVLMANMLRSKFNWSSEQTRNMILQSSKRGLIESETLIKFGITALQLSKLLSPI